MKPLFSFALILACAAPALADDKARTEEIVMGKCFVCHGVDGESSSPVFPRLAGQHAQYTENQLKAFNKRERTNDNAVMHAIASKLSELELKAVAAYISGLD